MLNRVVVLQEMDLFSGNSALIVVDSRAEVSMAVVPALIIGSWMLGRCWGHLGYWWEGGRVIELERLHA